MNMNFEEIGEHSYLLKSNNPSILKATEPNTKANKIKMSIFSTAVIIGFLPVIMEVITYAPTMVIQVQ